MLVLLMQARFLQGLKQELLKLLVQLQPGFRNQKTGTPPSGGSIDIAPKVGRAGLSYRVEPRSQSPVQTGLRHIQLDHRHPRLNHGAHYSFKLPVAALKRKGLF